MIPEITTEDFDRLLVECMKSMPARAILAVPGVYELLSEDLNNQILHDWSEEQNKTAKRELNVRTVRQCLIGK